MQRILREWLEGINERIDRVENSVANDDVEERSRRTHEERPRDNILSGIKIKVPHFKGKNDLEAYIEWETKIEQIIVCHNYTNAKKMQVFAIEFIDYALLWWN